jgi:hypothetical protein
MMFRIDSVAGTAGYSLAKKNYPVLSELQISLYFSSDGSYSITRFN